LGNWRWCFDGRIFLADAYIVLPGADGNNPKSAKVSNKRGLSLGISDLLLSLLLSTKITANVSSPNIDLPTGILRQKVMRLQRMCPVRLATGFSEAPCGFTVAHRLRKYHSI
jgi:hypothetical protein